jgi:hypothetical protein
MGKRKMYGVAVVSGAIFGQWNPLSLTQAPAIIYVGDSRAQDERQVIIGLTPKGRAFQKKCAVLPECIVSATGCSLDALDELTGQLQVLRYRFQDSVGLQKV